MNKELSGRLLESIEEMQAHERGEIDLPPQRICFVGKPDPREIRASMGLTQKDFAHLLGISVRTLQDWEQGRRSPEGPAMQLLKVAVVRPDALLAIA